MKHLFTLKTIMLACLLFVGMGAWAEEATMAAGTNGSSATVNEKDAIKVGTSRAGGDMTITVPAGATSLEFYAAAWSGVSDLNLNITPAANVSPTSVALTADTGISGNSPFTLSGTESSYKFTIALSNITAETTLTLTSSAAKRFVVWGATYTIPSVAYTVTFNAGTNGSCSTSSLTEASAGAGVTVPSVTPNTGYRFKGWSTTEATYTAATLTAGVFKPTANCTLYAFYDREYTAKFYVNGAQSGETQNLIEGETIVFPENPAIDDVTFMGWATAAIVGTQDAAPTMYNSATMGANNVEYYAVFAVSDISGSDEWVEITTTPVAGTYAICTDSYFMSATVSSNRFSNGSATPTIADGKLTIEPTSECTWVITKPDTYFRIQNGTKYAGGTNSKNQGALLDDAAVDLAKWSISYETDHFVIINYGRSQASTDSANKYLRNNTTSGWATYASATGNAPRLFKKVTGIAYSDYCTTVALDPKPTLVVSATELPEYAGNTNTSITASVSEGAYTGALTVASSADAVATASISEGTITINALTAGTATITVTAPAVTGFRKATATIAVTVSEKLAHGLAFDAATLNLTVGDTEFTEPTLSNPNSLPVVYSLVYATPANEGKVATINATTGKITLADPSLSTETQGAVTVKAATVGDNSHAAGEVTYNLVVARKVTTTSWSNGGAAVNIDQDEIATLPTASNDGERNLFYESSNTDVATIDNTGAVTFVAYGTTTITAKTSSTAEYAPTSATYELTFAPRYTVTFSINGEETVLREETSGAGVIAPSVDPIAGKVFRGWAEATINGTTNDAPAFVSTATLDGDKTLYAVFATRSGSALDYTFTIVKTDLSSASYSAADGSHNVTATCTTDSENTLTIAYTTSNVFQNSTLDPAKLQWKKDVGTLYNTTDLGSITSVTIADASNLNTHYGTTEHPTSGSSVGSGNGYFTISATSSAGSASSITVAFTKGSFTYSDYCTTVAATTTINITTPEGYSTFVCDNAIEIPEGVEGSTVTVAGDALTLAWEYKAGNVVPANTPILVKGTEGAHNANITTGGTVGTNYLVANTTGATETAYVLADDIDAKCYVLSYDKTGANLGFYWFTEKGDGDFDVPAGKVFLAVPGSTPARGFVLNGKTTGIKTVESVKVNNTVYNLAGQRVAANAKGIVIVNGKKMLNK